MQADHFKQISQKNMEYKLLALTMLICESQEQSQKSLYFCESLNLVS